MRLEKKILTNNDCYKRGQKITPRGIVVHSTGCNQPKQSVFINSWDKPNVAKCVHAFIGLDDLGKVSCTVTLPFNFRPWGVGSGKKGSFNSSHLQFEICEDNLKSKTYFMKCYKVAVQLCAFWCELYNISADKIVCHSEAHALGYGSNHADVMHWFPKHGKSMNTFRNDVQKFLTKGTCPFDKPKTTVKEGSSYNDVLWLQWHLRHVYKVNIDMDGIWGPQTATALLQYQKSLGWDGSGKAGTKTINALAKGRTK